ncbi:hypothetical protein [Thermospira aquatica]|uniref:Uncharacterized protein n=1 Tax=Thermospira aquatica TaxID=2828656 RepID=A0AAX3BE39_9SPIR|nr:hypothetical protein [Thermospira aquatica]URA10618.1 hypothetical protein KDW03_02095 [Thermospira aquatica]
MMWKEYEEALKKGVRKFAVAGGVVYGLMVRPRGSKEWEKTPYFKDFSGTFLEGVMHDVGWMGMVLDRSSQ